MKGQLTQEIAMDLLQRDVTVERSIAEWHGRLIGVVTRPSVILELWDGERVVIAIDGALYEERP